MQKQIHVNSYVKRDGTQVKEHFRNIDTDNYGTPPIVPENPNWPVLDEQNHNPLKDLCPNTFNPTMNMDSGPVLQGGVSVDVGIPTGGGIGDVHGSIGGVLGTVVAVGLELAPIALQIYQAMNSGNSQAVGYLKPQFDTKIKQLNTQVAQMKSNIDNNITKLVNAKNRTEYSKIYEPLQKDWQAYQHAKNIVNRIKVHANNGDFQSVANELGNFVSNNQKQIISDLLQPKVKLQNNTKLIPNSFKFNNNSNKSINVRNNISSILNNINSAFDHKYIDDATEFWNASVNDLNTDYIKNNGVVQDNVFKIPSKALQKIIINKLNTQNLNIENTKGVIFFEDSSISNAIANTKEFKNFVVKNKSSLLHGLVVNGSTGYNKFLSTNVFGAINNCDIVYMYIDDNSNIFALIIDTYEFNKNDPLWIVKQARMVQEQGLLIPFYAVIPIKVPKQIWQKW